MAGRGGWGGERGGGGVQCCLGEGNGYVHGRVGSGVVERAVAVIWER